MVWTSCGAKPVFVDGFEPLHPGATRSLLTPRRACASENPGESVPSRFMLDGCVAFLPRLIKTLGCCT